MNASEQGFIIISNNVLVRRGDRRGVFHLWRKDPVVLLAKCQADIVGLVSGESTIIITVNIRMRKYWINLLDKKFVWKWSLLWWGLCVQNVKSNIQKNWWLSCQFAHDFLIWKKQVWYKQRCVQWMWEWKNFPEFTWIYLNSPFWILYTLKFL